MNRYLALFLLFVLLVACRPTTSPSPTPLAAEPTVSRPEPTPTAIPPTTTPTPISPTATQTPIPPSPTLPPTNTPVVPTATPSPTTVPTPVDVALGPFQAVAAIPVPAGENWRLYLSPDEQLWLVTDSQVARLVDNIWQFYLSYAGNFRGIDSSGRVWVFRNNGLISAIDGTNGQTIYNQDSGWPAVDWAEEMVEDSSGRVWFLTANDIRSLDGEQWVITTFAEAGLEVAEDDSYEPTFNLVSNGTIWLSNCNWAGPGPAGGVGVRWFDGTSWQGADSPIQECIFDMLSAGPDSLWFGGESRLWHYNAGQWTYFNFPTAPAGSNGFGFVSYLTIDSTGTPWPILSICGGASCYAGEILYTLANGNWTAAANWNEQYPVAIHTDQQGNKWLFNLSGIFQWQNNELVLWPDLTPVQVPAGNATTQWFAADYQGQTLLWKMNQ